MNRGENRGHPETSSGGEIGMQAEENGKICVVEGCKLVEMSGLPPPPHVNG